MAAWLGTANARVHGTTRQVPAAVFAGQEAPCLLPAPADRYQVPYWATVKVHVDYHPGGQGAVFRAVASCGSTRDGPR